MEVQRNFFIFAFLFISFLLWQEWQKQSFLNDYQNKKNSIDFHIDPEKNNHQNQIIIKNDVIRLVVNMYGGDIEEASLLAYKDKLNSSKPLKLLETASDFVYQAQSGLIGKDGPDNAENYIRPLYHARKNFFELENNKEELRVPISFIKDNNIIYTKTFILKSGKYDVQVEYNIHNLSNDNLQLRMFGQLKQTIKLPKQRDIYSGNFALQTFRGSAYSSTDSKYEKYKFDNISKNQQLHILTKSGWVAMLQQYFTVAWIPEEDVNLNTIYTSYINHNIASIGYKSPLINIPSNSQSIIKSKLWIGPAIQKEMALVAPNLDLTVDYGWLWFLSQPLFKLLSILYNLIGNWGFSIILITFIMKAITYPLTKAQYVSMAKMRKLQPKINEIKKNFGNNKQRMSQEMMNLYKKEKINPLGGCLPVFIQMPIFLSLYYMLIGSVELRHAPFLLWIKDLSNQDPYYVLPIIMGITMFFIQKTSSNNISDPLQKKIMHFMPIIFTVFFLWFPSGLVLYYIVSNLVTIIQQKIILFNLKNE
ncbi:membrane protein insertase YidC [Buchnera aphidicola (Aphis helianthi)]|uniref:Membrane protein insertase YidC n=1 Tax=Buchnera aphidicola (Aphis helianthi) TaxID=2315802 RepID=A0A4D6XJG4_9GAMM|nr:membrane protein insertase YidC [Buchnera aphidicola]QCI16862.1 membrane protein insertase YidC [Buchnera aphidicola (Aphis helianthi)]